MQFEIRLPKSPSLWAFRSAGVEVDDLFDFWQDYTLYDRGSLPTTLKGEFFLSDPPAKLKVTVLGFKPTHVRIDVPSAAIGKEIRRKLDHYSYENDGLAVADREHNALWNQIETILKRDGLSYDRLQHGAVLTPRAIRSLMDLCEKQEFCLQANIYRLFDKHSVPKSERAFTAKWLVKLFEKSRDPDEEIGVALEDFVVPEIADDLIRLIKDRRYRDRRWVLCLALARTKHPRAAGTIASILGQGINTRGALEALGRLPAHKYVGKIREFLRDPDSDVRREAKKTLKKLGVALDAAPPPTHLVKRGRIPRSLVEWSANLDMDELEPTLKKLSRCLDDGFAQREIAEVLAVVEEMKPDQTRTFRFPVRSDKRDSELWLAVFMDDIDSPDLAIHGDKRVIDKLKRAAGMRK